MPKTYTLILVPETHWDREWHLPFEVLRMRLVRLTDKLLHLLDTDPEYTSFTFDGQTVVLEDYLAVRPEQEEKIRGYVQQGRLLIGPWYVLMDEFLVSGEALVRNLMLGHLVAERFGPAMKVGYVPDPFGHVAQLPQILRGFGIDSAVFWRGLGPEWEGLNTTEFWWAAPDGTRVLAVCQLNDYCNASGLGYVRGEAGEQVLDLDDALRRVQGELEALSARASTRYLLLNNGCDHVEPQPELPRIIAHVNRGLRGGRVVHGTYPDYVKGVLSEKPNLGRLRGEIHSPQRTWILSGILSARMYLKQANERVQTLLEKWVEPFCALAWLRGGRYDHALLWQAWRQALQNQPHDSIGGCSADEVHRDMMPRFDAALHIGRQLRRESLHHLAGRVNTTFAAEKEDTRALVVFNPLGWPVNGTVSADLELSIAPGEAPCEYVVRDAKGRALPTQIVGQEVSEWRHGAPQGHLARRVNVCFSVQELPALGYRAYALEPVRQAPRVESDLVVGPMAMENRHLRVTINANGTVDIDDKETGAAYPSCNLFESADDAGDEYDYSPAPQGATVTSASAAARVEQVAWGPVCARFRISLELELPEGLDERRVARSRRTIRCPIATTVTLWAGVRRVDFQTVVQNRACDHRLRALFPTGIDAPHSDAEQAFCVVDRPLGLPDYDETWAQQPQPTHPQQTFVDVHDSEKGLTVINRGLPEYEARPGPGGVTVCLTLLRCVGWLSRPDLQTRPGNAGLSIPTPEAQCIGSHEFHYAAAPHAGTWRDAGIWVLAHGHNAPPLAVLQDQHKGRLPKEFSLVAASRPEIVVSAVKKAERSEALIVRACNITDDKIQGRLVFGRRIKAARLVNLNEEPLRGRAPAVADNAISLRLKPTQIVTLEVTLR